MRGVLRTAVIAMVAASWHAIEARAAEGGTSVYLLGFRGALAGFVPPPGTYFQSDKIYYHGEAQARGSRSRTISGQLANFQIAGVLVAEVEADVRLDALTGTWIAKPEVLGGHFGLSLTVPVGWSEVTAGTESSVTARLDLVPVPISRSRTIDRTRSRTDDVTSYGDPFLMALLGWHAGRFHWNANVGVNVPVGDWKLGRLANLGFNRWAVDTGVAVTWLDPRSGIELTAAPGVTFNGENPDTDYRTGTEFHVEFAAMKHLGKRKKVAVGVTGYHYEQLTGDSGSGARLGAFKGRATGIGPKLILNFNVRDVPVTVNTRWMREYNAKHRLRDGQTGLLTVAFPLGARKNR